MVPGPAKVVEPPKEVEGDSAVSTPSAPIGSIYRLDAAKKEVLVKTRRIFRMGERVYAEVGEEKAIMAATFPMLTSSKCALEAASRKYFGRLSKGMPCMRTCRMRKRWRSVGWTCCPKGFRRNQWLK
jgi:hypothetical protein